MAGSTVGDLVFVFSNAFHSVRFFFFFQNVFFFLFFFFLLCRDHGLDNGENGRVR